LTGPLLTPLDVSEWGDDEYAAVGALFDILGVLARHPKMARVFMSYNALLLQRGELPLRLRELAILRLSHARRSAFLGPSSRPRLPCALGQHAGPGLTGTRKPR
jgi:4-carboxymuconolactone decarboxylase